MTGIASIECRWVGGRRTREERVGMPAVIVLVATIIMVTAANSPSRSHQAIARLAAVPRGRLFVCVVRNCACPTQSPVLNQISDPPLGSLDGWVSRCMHEASTIVAIRIHFHPSLNAPGPGLLSPSPKEKIGFPSPLLLLFMRARKKSCHPHGHQSSTIPLARHAIMACLDNCWLEMQWQSMA